MPQNLKDFLSIPIQFFQHAGKQHYAALGVGLLVAFLYFKIFFGDRSGFKQDVENDLKRPILDQDYDYVESQWSHNKILIWISLSVGSGILAYYQLPTWFPHWFPK